MATDPGPFSLTRLPVVDRQITDLLARIKSSDTRRKVRQIVRAIFVRLRTNPLEFGDPIYHTKKAGGTVCHSFLRPISVHFVVFESERVVCILKIQKPIGWD